MVIGQVEVMGLAFSRKIEVRTSLHDKCKKGRRQNLG